MKLIYNVSDKPKLNQLIIFAIQQLLAIMAATLVVPIIIGHEMSPAAALFGAGIGTLVYLLFTKFKSPVFLGSSFAFLGSMSAAFAGGVSMSLGYLGLILGAPKQYNPNQIFPVGDGFGLFVYFEKFEDTHFKNGIIKRPDSKPRGPRKKKQS